MHVSLGQAKVCFLAILDLAAVVSKGNLQHLTDFRSLSHLSHFPSVAYG